MTSCTVIGDADFFVVDNPPSRKLKNIEYFLLNKNIRFVNESIANLKFLYKNFEGVDGAFYEEIITDVSKSKDVFGFTLKYSIPEVLSETVGWFGRDLL